MAKAPWARLTNPIRPIVTESPTETMNSTVPADSPPTKMLAKLLPKTTANPVSTLPTRGEDREQRTYIGRTTTFVGESTTPLVKSLTYADHFFGAHRPIACALHSSFT